MDGEHNELINLIKVLIFVFLSLCYSYYIARTSKFSPGHGFPRFLFLLPVIFLFLYLPLLLTTSIHLRGTAVFFIAWMANFKLLLCSFNKPPLTDPSISLSTFIIVACLPIKIQQNRKDPDEKTTKIGSEFSSTIYAIKALFFALFVVVYEYRLNIEPNLVLFLYCFYVYFLLENLLAMSAIMARNLLGTELEPAFKEPYYSTSLQDFWGRRWNLIVSGILRPTVYIPTRKLATYVVRREWAQLPAVMCTFLVSGLLHELMFYYMGRMWPSWNVTWFFVFHGLCLLVEIIVRKAMAGRWWLPPVVSGTMTVGFVLVTAQWWFFPEFFRCRIVDHAFEDYAAIGDFFMKMFRI